jgi:hypothetical protein
LFFVFLVFFVGEYDPSLVIFWAFGCGIPKKKSAFRRGYYGKEFSSNLGMQLTLAMASWVTLNGPIETA